MTTTYMQSPKTPKMHKAIISLIPIGKENAVTRKQLSEITGIGDRQIRESVEFARESGEIILSSSHISGYWESDDILEIKQFVKETRSRIKKLMVAKQSAEKAIVSDMMSGGEFF